MFGTVRDVSNTVKIGTRQSQLALWQANHVRDALIALDPELQVELVGITTEGDRILDRPLAASGGKGLFLKELEVALTSGEIDLAVHSMKDVTVTMPEGLDIPVVMASADPRDALVSAQVPNVASLKPGAVVGTSSLRRSAALMAMHPEIVIKGLRGNVNTRLAKLDSGEFDAIVLAVAGLERIDLSDRIRERIAPEDCLPAVGQGVVGIQCRDDDARIRQLIAPLNDAQTTLRISAERAVNARLEGGCHMPLAAFATFESSNELRLRAQISYPDGTSLITEDVRGPRDDAASIGEQVGESLLERGARTIIASVSGIS